MDYIRERAADWAVTDFIPYGGLVNTFIRWGASRMLGYSTRTVEILVGINELEKKYPLANSLKWKTEIYAYWLSGEGISPFYKEELRAGIIKQLIVPHPETPYLKSLRQSLGDVSVKYDFARQILSTTKLARQYGIPVKWHMGFTGVSSTIWTDKKQDGWIHLDIIWPFISSEHRHVIRIEKKRDPDIFSQYKEAFDRLWSSIPAEVAGEELGNLLTKYQVSE